jgi:hypothetical protein
MAIQFGNIDRELADRQNVIKEDAARQYRGSRDTMKSITDLGDTVSFEVKQYKARKRQEEQKEYDRERNEKSDEIRGEQHSMYMMKSKLDANTLQRERAQQNYNLKKWPFGKMETKKRYENETKALRESTLLGWEKMNAYPTLYSAEALEALADLKTMMNDSEFDLSDESAKNQIRKVEAFTSVGMMEWATNNKLYDTTDYGNPTAEADADATKIINFHMPGFATDANDLIKRYKSNVTYAGFGDPGGPEGTDWGDPDTPSDDGDITFTGFKKDGDKSQLGKFDRVLERLRKTEETTVPVEGTDTTPKIEGEAIGDEGKNFTGKDPKWYDYLFAQRSQKIKENENRDMTNELILDRDPHETTNSEIYHNLRVLEGYSGGEMVDDNRKLIAAGSVDANGLINKSPEQRDMLISVLGITDPAKKKEWESYLMSDNVNKAYGYVKPGSPTGARQDTITSEQQQKRSLLKLNPDQVSSLQRWAYNKSLGEMDRNHPHLSGGKAYKEIPYLKHILGDMGFRHGSSFMVKKEGDTGRYPKFGNAVKELTEADTKDKQLAAWEKMDNELFSTGIYSKGREGKSGEESQRFRFLRDRMDRLKNWITEGQYKGGGLFGGQYLQKK